jgi:hypothetical protein
VSNLIDFIGGTSSGNSWDHFEHEELGAAILIARHGYV